MKILTAAIFTRLILNRHLDVIRWIGLIILFAGISIVEVETLTSKKIKIDEETIHGLAAITVSCKFKKSRYF